jgi:hypothetical protein
MNRITARYSAWTLALMTLALPGLLLASEPEKNQKSDADGSQIVIVGDDGEELTVTLADGALTMISTENGHTTTRIMDMEAMGLLAADAVEEAMWGMDEVLAELEDLQLDVHMGQDNRLNLKVDDTEFEVDLDQILSQVASAVQVGLDEIDTGDWTDRRSRWDDVSDAELRVELDNLKDEMKELRRELRRLQQDKKRP